jgi:hypothetical protein
MKVGLLCVNHNIVCGCEGCFSFRIESSKVRCEVLLTMCIKFIPFWDVTLCCLVDLYQCLR